MVTTYNKLLMFLLDNLREFSRQFSHNLWEMMEILDLILEFILLYFILIFYSRDSKEKQDTWACQEQRYNY